eukprot:358893-Chlamydomonas_euryale.AAC.3
MENRCGLVGMGGLRQGRCGRDGMDVHGKRGSRRRLASKEEVLASWVGRRHIVDRCGSAGASAAVSRCGRIGRGEQVRAHRPRPVALQVDGLASSVSNKISVPPW